MASEIAGIAGKVFNIALEVYKRVEEMLRNERNQQRILEHSKQLRDFVGKLSNDEILNESECSKDLSKAFETLGKCNIVCFHG